LEINEFFSREQVDVYAETDLATLPLSDQTYVRRMLPSALSVIVFGKEVPVSAYRGTSKEKTAIMLKIAESLDKTAENLAGVLNDVGIPAIPVPLYLPVRVVDGKVQGVVRLKQVAAAGGIGSQGRNSVLISPRYGPRLLMSGVITSRAASAPGAVYPDEQKSGECLSVQCTGCGRCITLCPGSAIGPDGVEVFQCMTIRPWVPPRMVPLVKWILGRHLFLVCVAPLAPLIARMATIRCSLCVTGCPLFEGVHDERGKPSG
jgi:epoxyqueuosine reductase QueG